MSDASYPLPTAPAGSVYAPRPPVAATNGLAIAAFVVSFLWGLLGLVLGLVALRHVRRDGSRGEGLAIAAIVIGSVRFAVELGLAAYLVLGMATTSGDVSVGSAIAGAPAHDPSAPGTCYASTGNETDCLAPDTMEVVGVLTSVEADADAACSRLLDALELGLTSLGATEVTAIHRGEDLNGPESCVIRFLDGDVTGSVLAGTAAR